MNNRGITGLGVQEAPKPLVPTELGANDTRYGFIPIWTKNGLHAHAFRASTLPANEVLQFKLFRVPQLNEDGEFIDITPENQVRDLYNIAGAHYATDFPELAKLKNEELVNSIVVALTPKASCENYPAQLKNRCATCWKKYLENFDVNGYFSEELQKPAQDTKDKLLHALTNGLSVANVDFNDSVKQVETKKKSALSDQDKVCMMHLHKKEPNFSGSQSMDGLGAEIAKGLSGVMNNQHGGVTKADIVEIVAGAVAPLQAKIEAQEKELAELRPQAKVKCAAITASNEQCKNDAEANGYCKNTAHAKLAGEN